MVPCTVWARSFRAWASRAGRAVVVQGRKHALRDKFEGEDWIEEKEKEGETRIKDWIEENKRRGRQACARMPFGTPAGLVPGLFIRLVAPRVGKAPGAYLPITSLQRRPV
jgi:hypothetical protein